MAEIISPQDIDEARHFLLNQDTPAKFRFAARILSLALEQEREENSRLSKSLKAGEYAVETNLETGKQREVTTYEAKLRCLRCGDHGSGEVIVRHDDANNFFVKALDDARARAVDAEGERDKARIAMMEYRKQIGAKWREAMDRAEKVEAELNRLREYFDSKCGGCPDCGNTACSHPDRLARANSELARVKAELANLYDRLEKSWQTDSSEFGTIMDEFFKLAKGGGE